MTFEEFPEPTAADVLAAWGAEITWITPKSGENSFKCRVKTGCRVSFGSGNTEEEALRISIYGLGLDGRACAQRIKRQRWEEHEARLELRCTQIQHI